MKQILTPECLTYPPTGINLTQAVGRFDMYIYVSPKTNRRSFCLILKLSHALDGLLSVLSRLHGCKYKCIFCWMKDQWTWLLQILLLGIVSGMEPTIYFQIYSYRCCDNHFPCFGKYILPQLHTWSAYCTEGSCSSNISSNF